MKAKHSSSKRIFAIFSVFLSLLFISLPDAHSKTQADVITVDLQFDAPKITRSRIMPRYFHVEMKGARSLGVVGEPVLPVKALKVLIPPLRKVLDIEVIPGEKVTLPGRREIEPGQREYPLSQINKKKRDIDRPKPEVYKSNNVYPAQRQRIKSQQQKLGYTIGMFNFFPVEYNPKEMKISYYKTATVRIKLQPEVSAKTAQQQRSSPRRRAKAGVKEEDKERIRRLIDNKEDIGVYDQALNTPAAATTSTSALQALSSLGTSTSSLTTAPQVQGASAAALSPIGAIPAGSYQYVIITSSAFSSAFEPLKLRRTQGGLPATIVTTEWIYANYPGTRPDGKVDDQTKIRNFIIDAYNNWGTKYVLLGGDGDGSPVGGESGPAIIPARGLSDQDDNNIPADLYYACLDGTFDSNANGIYGEPTDGENNGEVDLLAEVYVGRAPVDSFQEAVNFVNKTLAYEDSTDVGYLQKNYMLGEHIGFGGVAEYATAAMEQIRQGSDIAGFTTQGFLSNSDRALDTSTLYDGPGLPEWTPAQLTSIINSGVHILNHLGHSNVNFNMKFSNADADALTNKKYFIGYSQGCYDGSFDNRTDLPSVYTTSDSIVEHFTTHSSGAVAFVANSRYGYGSFFSTIGSSQYYNRQFWDALFGEGIYELGRMNQDSKEDNIPYFNFDMNRWCYFELNLFGDPALPVRVPASPVVTSVKQEVIDTGDKDGLLDPADSADLVVTLKALNQDASNLSATLSTNSPYITIVQPSASYGTLLKGLSVGNSTYPFKIKIAPDCPTGAIIDFTLTVAANGYYDQKKFPLFVADPRERLITPDTNAQYSPVIDGNRIVWMDWRNGNADIYMYDLSTNKERQITSNMDSQYAPVISGNIIAWEDWRNGNADIYMYDLSTNTERRITTNTADQQWPRISGNRIVWEDWRGYSPAVYMYDLTTKTTKVIVDVWRERYPLISGNLIVWDDYRNWDRNTGKDNVDVYSYDLSTKTERRITSTILLDEFSAAISGNRVLVNDPRNGDYDIYMYDLSTNTERRITTDGKDQWTAGISGDRIIWMNDYGFQDAEFNLYDLNTNTGRRLPINSVMIDEPCILGDRIVFSDYRNGNDDIYLYDFGLAPIGSIVINGDAPATNSALVTLTVSAKDLGWDETITQMQFSNNNSTWSTPEAYATTKTWNLTSGDGTKTVYAKFKASSGKWSTAVISDTIVLDTVVPIGSISINNGSQYTKSPTVTINSAISDARSGMGPGAEMQFSNDNVTWSAPEPYATTKAWTLPSGDGPKTVYAKFKDVAGNWTAGAITGTIILDTAVPGMTIDLPTKDALIPDNVSLVVKGTVSDNIGVKSVYLDIYDITDNDKVLFSGVVFPYDAGNWSTANNKTPAGIVANINIPTSALIVGHVIGIEAGPKDNAGNWGSSQKITVTVVDKTAPSAPGMPTLTSGTNPTNTGTYSFAWTASTDGPNSIKGYDVYRGVPPSGFFSSTTYQKITQVTSNSYSENNMPEGLYVYKVYAVDNAGNTSAESEKSTMMIVDKTVPAITGISSSAASFDPEAGQSLAVSYTINDNSFTTGFTATLTVYNSSGAIVAKNIRLALLSGSNSFSWGGKNSSGAYVPNGVYRYTIQVTDGAGNAVVSGSYFVTKK